ncbi:MAG: alpha/beta hydrolase [Melioribacteraceae bacterium]|nr:alpha/beta hydrolase [Melioribacteraceae bacterium]
MYGFNLRTNFVSAVLLLVLFIPNLFAQNSIIIRIWEGKPSYNFTSENLIREETDSAGITRYYDITIPELEFIKPGKPNGTAVIICPGGGYHRMAYTTEGYKMGQWFASMGISAFILKYRIPSDLFMDQKELVPLADAQQSILHLRENASKYGINADKIGIIGFSAGGHVASTLSTHFGEIVIPNPNDISFRPDFSILIYPVISMLNGITHNGSRNNLLGDNPSGLLVDQFSNEKHVTDKTPPTFLMHASDDTTVPVQNSLLYYEALKKNSVIAALHIFQQGGHGFAMRNKYLDKQWLYLLSNWLVENDFIAD